MGKIFGKININNFFPFLHDVRTYSLSKFKLDLVAGLTVAIVGTPQAIAYAIIAGVDPRFGLYACIVPVIVASLMGSSRFLVAGPTNTVSMVIFSTLATLSIGGVSVSGFSDVQKMELVFLISIIAGIIQVVLGAIRAGNLLNFISHSVIVGFTAGAGILIGFNQVKNLLGLKFHSSAHFIDSTIETFQHIGSTDWRALLLGAGTIIFVVVAKKISPKIPGSLLALIFSGAIVAFTGWLDKGLATVGSIPQSLPPLSHPIFNLDVLNELFMPSLAIAILGVVEAYSIAKSFSAKSGDKVDGNQEFIGQGLANISAGFFSGIPGTGSFTRSAVNFDSNAATRFSAMMSAFMVLAIVILFAGGAKYIPIASLAGILIVIAYSMIDKHAFSLAFRATKADRIVLIVTMIATLTLHLDQAVYLGVAMSIILFMRKVSNPQVFPVAPAEKGGKLCIAGDDKGCPHMEIYQVDGSLFFGAVNEIESKISGYIRKGRNVFIIRLAHVRLIDATGVHALDNLLHEAQAKNASLMFTNLKPGVCKVLKRTGMEEKIGKENFFEHTHEAIEESVARIRRAGKCQGCPIRCFEECDK